MSDERGGFLYQILAEPATRGMAVDDPALTVRRRELSKTKCGLRLSYRAWYRELERVSEMAPPGTRVELGSGGGFLEEQIAGMLKTDVLPLPFPSDSARMRPPCISTMRRARARPTPVPEPRGSRRRNTSNTLSRSAGSIPTPLSRT